MTDVRELSKITQTVTIDELMNFINSTIRRPEGKSGNSLQCAICQTDSWTLTPYPGDVKKPVITSHPIPFSQQRAIWYFSFSCENCGYTIFLDAQTVTKSIVKGRES
ncbi:TPA: hypothetical protein ACV98Q_002252 [Yersinia enterocolitica]|uniref:hypothetical protein n=1 Tax=Yersinia enterocolitica TaxID=630 RepID=UPI001E55609E|nr:hypothetical protein [Yersinia enterocolitica]MCE3086606.1 hypothetical protein [Yersinia enterocolitica]UNA06024.1 hypothetical protein vBYenM3014_029 [Yersinia phage vB_YenM_30.14]